MKMKNIILTSLVLLLSISLVACNKNEKISGDDISLEETLDEEGIDKSFRLDSKAQEWCMDTIEKIIFDEIQKNNDGYDKFKKNLNAANKKFDSAKEKADEFRSALLRDGSRLNEVNEWRGHSEEDIYNALIVALCLNDVDELFIKDDSEDDEYLQREYEQRKNEITSFLEQQYNNQVNNDFNNRKGEIEDRYNQKIEQSTNEKEKQYLTKERDNELKELREMIEEEYKQSYEDQLKSQLDDLRNGYSRRGVLGRMIDNINGDLKNYVKFVLEY